MNGVTTIRNLAPDEAAEQLLAAHGHEKAGTEGGSVARVAGTVTVGR